MVGLWVGSWEITRRALSPMRNFSMKLGLPGDLRDTKKSTAILWSRGEVPGVRPGKHGEGLNLTR